MMSLRRSAQILLQQYYPLSPGEVTSHYLAFIPLEDYGPCIQIVGRSLESQAQLLEATDNFSIASLKAISNLWTLQQSEFVRCLAVCFQSLSQWPANRSQTISIQRILRQVIQPAWSTLEESSKSLKFCFDFHYASTVEKDERKPRVMDSGDVSLKGLYVAVHSLDLHLQSALRTCRTLATEIEKSLEGNKGDASPTDDGSKDWMNQLERVHAELAACQDCWAEGQAQSERLFKSEVTSPVDKEDNFAATVAHPVQTKPVVEIVGDPVITDEVFEAYVDEEDADLQSSTWDEFLSPEEKAKKKKEKEEALRLLSELKTVISGLAEERKKKEDEILRAKLGVQNTGPVIGDTETGHRCPGSVSDTHLPDGVQGGNKPVCKADNKMAGKVKSSTEKQSLQSQGAAEATKVLEDEDNPESSSKLQPEACERTLTNISDTKIPEEIQAKVAERLERSNGASIPFASFIASQAVAKSRLLGLEAETFGDSDEESDVASDEGNEQP